MKVLDLDPFGFRDHKRLDLDHAVNPDVEGAGDEGQVG